MKVSYSSKERTLAYFVIENVSVNMSVTSLTREHQTQRCRYV
jgi:hypothetical protein